MSNWSKKPALGVFLLLITSSSILFLKIEHHSQQVHKEVLAKAIIRPSVTPTLVPTISLTPSFSPTPTILQPKRPEYSVAIIGDSYVDTMGEYLQYLDAALKVRYPHTSFRFYNYGIGSQNVEIVHGRFNSDFNYESRHYPPLSTVKPDILVVGSCSYNPFDPYDLVRHRNGLVQLLQDAKADSSHVYLLVEIAPLKTTFGKGPHGINWDQAASLSQAQHITEQLQDSLFVGRTQKISIIDAYTPTKDKEGFTVFPTYTNADDGVHPSVAGESFMAEKIADALDFFF